MQGPITMKQWGHGACELKDGAAGYVLRNSRTNAFLLNNELPSSGA
ncbi:hypothetical protein B0G57_11813 [Trinickia symbiotica]|nr:hypothetical protein B0G57_11813 [Trinickia symbiotica]